MSDVSSTARPTGLTRGLLAANLWVVYAFFYAPIVLLVVFSFNSSRLIGKWEGGTLEWYRELADNQEVQDAIWISVKVGLISTVVSVVLGTLAALSLERFRWRGQRVFDALLYLPIIIPDVTMAVMMLAFFTQGFEVVDSVFGTNLTKGFNTIVLSHVAFSISFVSVVVRARLSGLDETLEEAAADLYAGRWQAFRYITLPLIMPGVLGGALLALTLSLDDVVITQFVAGPGATTLPVFVFSFIRKGVTPLINAVSVLMLSASILLVALSLLAERLAGRTAPEAVADDAGALAAGLAVSGPVNPKE